MLKENEFFENMMKSPLEDYSIEELVALENYNRSKMLNLDYPIFTDSYGTALSFAQVIKDANVDRFIFADSSARALDILAILQQMGYGIMGTITIADYLGDNKNLTPCMFGFLLEW
jgi:hypothetical protein